MANLNSALGSEFFIVVPPGLEYLALEELKAKLQHHRLKCESMEATQGGICIRSDMEIGLILNHVLKIPTRILLRIAEFSCKDLPKLYNKTRKIEWSKYLRQGEHRVLVSSHASRLRIKAKIESTVKDAIEDYAAHQTLRKDFLKTPQTVYLRIHQDEVVVSVDTTGEGLHQRGHKPYSTEATIRENLAAALAMLFWKHRKYSPSTQETTVVDLMAGSGTLGFEAATFLFGSFGKRPFSYQNFPEIYSMPKLAETKGQFRLYFFENNLKAFEALNKNILIFIGNYPKNFTCEVQSSHRDIFDSEIPKHANWFCNPPYGIRLGADLVGLSSQFRELVNRFKPSTFSLIWPGLSAPKLGFKWLSTVKTKNGGIPITLNIAVFDSSGALKMGGLGSPQK